MELWHPIQLAEPLAIPYLLIVLYFIGCGLSLGNYVGYFRFHDDIYGSTLPQAYLAFVIIGSLTYVMFSAVMWVWAAKYSSTSAVKAIRLQWGVWAMFLFKDFPIFCMEYDAILCCGWLNSYQDFCFIMQLLYVLFSFIFTWLSFIWRAASWMNYSFGSYHEALKTGTEQVIIFPTPPRPMSENRGSPHELMSPLRMGDYTPRAPSARDDGGSYVPPVEPNEPTAVWVSKQIAESPPSGSRGSGTRLHRRTYSSDTQGQNSSFGGSHRRINSFGDASERTSLPSGHRRNLTPSMELPQRQPSVVDDDGHSAPRNFTHHRRTPSADYERHAQMLMGTLPPAQFPTGRSPFSGNRPGMYTVERHAI
jgi:hypothetical protein